MTSLKTFTIMPVILIVGLLVLYPIPANTAETSKEKSNNSMRAKFRFLFNNEEVVKTFIVDLPNSETVRSDILPDIKAQQDQRLQESVLLQKEQLQQIQDNNLKLAERIESQTSIMNQQKEELYDNITSIMDLRIEKQLTSLGDTLRKEMKQLFENQQHISYENCENRKSCAETMMCLGNDNNEIHNLYLPGSNLNPFPAYCLQDPENGTAWTVIQRRQDNSTDFFRGWEEYKRGFGNLNSNFFIGLEKLHAMTQAQQHELWIYLEDSKGEKFFAKYERFAIGNENDKYALDISNKFIGNVGGALALYTGTKFTTKDSDNDDSQNNCAEKYKGAWWYDDCIYRTLNDMYQGERGIVWYNWHAYEYTLKYVHMAVRPRN